MDWITASLLMFSTSVIFYLVARKAALLEISTEFINLSSSSFAILFYLIMAYYGQAALTVSPKNLLYIFILSIIGSYLPNVASFESIRFAPNPGYSLIISKSYVVFTTIAAILLFGSPITLKSAFAITLIVIFSILVTVGKTKPHKHSNNLWLPLAFGAFFGWGILSLGSKYLLTVGVSVYQRLIYLAVFITSYALGEILVKKKRIKKFSLPILGLMVSLGLFFSLFNFFMLVAIDKAPNIGYVNAINAGSVSVLTIFSSLLFKDEFTIRKFVGVVGVTIGIIILVV